MLKLQAIGHLGRDAIINQVNGKTVINFSVAHSEKHKNGEGQDIINTTWIDCAYWVERTAVAQYLTKGIQVHVDGKPAVKLYKTRDGQAAVSMTMQVFSVQLLGGNKDASQQPADGPESNEKKEVEQQLQPQDDLPF